MADDTLLLSRKEAARLLGMSLSSFNRHVAPHLEVVYVGGRRLYTRRGLERWIADNACRQGQAA